MEAGGWDGGQNVHSPHSLLFFAIWLAHLRCCALVSSRAPP